MSTGSKSKSKSAMRVVKENSKSSSKPSSAPVHSGVGVPAGAYNPVSGTFQSMETAPSASSPALQKTSRFQAMDDPEDHSENSLGTHAEYDSMSNNDSCSGESEDHKEKAVTSPTPRAGPIPGSDTTDKRDKIRQKNERKHQRQKEKRAQELHERCSGYLMSRKLEVLAQQLVGMGFSSERATLALMLNEGRVEDSVAWLLEGGEEDTQQIAKDVDEANLKIDISDELAKITEMEIQFKCTKQEVERAVVACEGDLHKAADSLKALKVDPPAAPQKLEEFSDINRFNSKLVTSSLTTPTKTLAKGATATGILQHTDDRDLNYMKTMIAGVMPKEVPKKNLQTLQSSRRMQSTPDWLRLQAASLLEPWPVMSSGASVAYPSPPLQTAGTLSKSGTSFAVMGTDVKTHLQGGTLREPIIMMQRPHSVNGKSTFPSTSDVVASQSTYQGWYSNGVSSMEMMANVGLRHSSPKLIANGATDHYHPQKIYEPFFSSRMERAATGLETSLPSSSSPIAVPASLGLFTGWGSSGSSGSSSPVGWNMGGSMLQVHYTCVDWSLDSTPLKGNHLHDSWSASFMDVNAARPVMSAGTGFGGLRDVGSLRVHPSPSVVSQEWNSPFAGKDLFSVPRQYVTSPSL